MFTNIKHLWLRLVCAIALVSGAAKRVKDADEWADINFIYACEIKLFAPACV